MNLRLCSSISIGILVSLFLAGCTVTQQQTAYYNAGTAVAISAVKKGDPKTAETEFLVALGRARQRLGEREVAEALVNLGQFYRLQHRYPEAIPRFEEALPIADRIYGPEDERTAEVLGALAASYLAGDQLNDARPFIERLRPIAPKLTGSERESVEMLFKAVESKPADVEVAKYLAAKAAAGDAVAQYRLGVHYELGLGVPQDMAKARELYLSADSKGCIQATHYLGVLYDKGRGVAVDDKQAAYWYRKAADAGFALAQFNYGVFLAHGRGVERNSTLALEYFRKADAQHYPGAKHAIEIVERQLANGPK